MQLRTVLDVNVVDVQKRRNPSKHYVSFFFFFPFFHFFSAKLLVDFSFLRKFRLCNSYVAAFTVCWFSCQSRYSDHFDPCDPLNFPERTSSDDVWKETLCSTILTRSLFVFHLKQRQVIWSTKANKHARVCNSVVKMIRKHKQNNKTPNQTRAPKPKYWQ